MTAPQDKDWAVTTATERVTLDADRSAETTVTVTNLRDTQRSATVAIATDDTAKTWFTVDDPTRIIDRGASVPYLVKVAVPHGAPPAEYAFQAQAYTSDAAPEETGTYSNRILLEVPGGPKPQPKFKFWWLVIPAALILIAATVVITVVLTKPATAPTVPDVTSMNEADATSALERAGLKPVIMHRHNPTNAGAVTTSIPAGTEVPTGTTVVVVYDVSLTVPASLSPPTGTKIRPLGDYPGVLEAAYQQDLAAVDLRLGWKQNEGYVVRWRVAIWHASCSYQAGGTSVQNMLASTVEIVTAPAFRSTRHFTNRASAAVGVFSCGFEQWTVMALDDFGNPGPLAWGTYNIDLAP